jgi:hypothetical protein
MSKRFEQALIALIKEQGSNADALFKSFVNEHLGITDEPVTEDDNDDQLSGDIEAEPDDTGLTETEYQAFDLEVKSETMLFDKLHDYWDEIKDPDMEYGNMLGQVWFSDHYGDPLTIEIIETAEGIIAYFTNDAMYYAFHSNNAAQVVSLIKASVQATNDEYVDDVDESSESLLSTKTAPEIHLTNDQEHQAFYLKYNEWRGARSENEDNLVQIRTEGKCLAEIHCEMEDQYTLQIFELGGNYYGLTTTINTGEHDYYEHLGFDNDADVQTFIQGLQSDSDSSSLDEAAFDDIYYHGGADVSTSDLTGNDLGVLYVTRNKKAAEYFKSQREDEGDAKLHRLVLANKKFAPEDMVVKIANDIGIDKSTYPDGTSQLFDPEYGDEEEKEDLVNQLRQAGYQGAYITDNVGFGNFRAVAFFV